MATKTIILDDRFARKLLYGIERPFKESTTFFKNLAVLVDKNTQQTFRKEGARSGMSKWPDYSPRTIRTEVGTWKIKYGTDGTPKPWTPDKLQEERSRVGFGYRGEIKKGVRRHNGKNLLQASGSFRRSFRTIKIAQNGLEYGTNYRLAKDIMSNPERQVLFVTPKDITLWHNLFRNFINERVKF